MFDQLIYKRYGVKCFCGSYKPYRNTLKPGVAYSMLMRPDDCVTCYNNDIKKKMKPTK